ncbi:MAG: ABC transporter permease subunit [Gemmatimonas sp.]|nr:ABC transporter permease subunit [Gemmatimonas sp.]
MIRVFVAGAIALTASAVAQMPSPIAAPADPIVVASKPFGESYLLAEMFAQILENGGLRVDRRPGLGATGIAFRALRTGAIDLYPEYTGTGLVAILGEEPTSDPGEVFRRVAVEFPRRYDVHWLPTLGFQNTYAIAVRRETADQYGLRSLSDLARVAPELSAGFSPDFIGREDGLPRLADTYALSFRETRPLLQAVKYQALDAGEVDVIDGYSTDGFIARYDLVVLEDDRGVFPAYEAAPLAGGRLQSIPEAVAALSALSGRLDEERMRALNERVEVLGEPIEQVAWSALEEIGLVAAAGETAGGDLATTHVKGGLLPYLWVERSALLRQTLRHLLLVGASMAAAIVVGIGLGLALERAGRGAEPTIRSVGVLQTIPGIALLAFMIPILGIGVLPALVALFLYSLYPILRNTFTGVRDASPEAVDAATGLGMTQAEVLRYVRFPLATPTIMAGVRTSAVINVGTATLAAFIGAGGLGDPIVTGLALSDTRMILSGAIPAALLALAVEGVLGWGERRVRTA